MTFQEALDYIWSLVNYETRPPDQRDAYTLDRFQALLDQLGNPQQQVRAIHIAGSKGKGSTAAMIESILRTAGYKTGFYISPHLHTPRERIRTAGTMIPEAAFIDLVARLRPMSEALGDVTTFEFLTAMGFVYFLEQAIDIAVIEVGLGGRLDATNVITPLVSVITPISLEHTKILGTTLPEIATEKGGIIKPGVPLVSAPQEPAALTTLLALANQRQAPAVVVDQHWHWQREAVALAGQQFTLAPAHPEAEPTPQPYAHLTIPFLGTHQLANAATALTAVQHLPPESYPVSEVAIRQGLATVSWPGRIELLSRRPLVIADGAHNDASAKALASTLTDIQEGGLVAWQELWLIIGAMGDKDIGALFAPLLPLATRLILTHPDHPRALHTPALHERLQASGLTLPQVQHTANVAEAVAVARQAATPATAIIATGSLSLAAEFRQHW